MDTACFVGSRVARGEAGFLIYGPACLRMSGAFSSHQMKKALPGGAGTWKGHDKGRALAFDFNRSLRSFLFKLSGLLTDF
jgi:hypothetical protein